LFNSLELTNNAKFIRIFADLASEGCAKVNLKLAWLENPSDLGNLTTDWLTSLQICEAIGRRPINDETITHTHNGRQFSGI